MYVYVIYEQDSDGFDRVIAVTDNENDAADFCRVYNHRDYHAPDREAWFSTESLNELPKLEPKYSRDQLEANLREKMEALRQMVSQVTPIDEHRLGLVYSSGLSELQEQIESCLEALEPLKSEVSTEGT